MFSGIIQAVGTIADLQRRDGDVRLVVDAPAFGLETSALGDSIDGHLVSGHVDGIGRVVSIETDARSQRWTFEAPPELMKYIATKGSISVDGTSLTVNEVGATRFGVNLIPHTIAATTFRSKGTGAAVNLEIDLVARYVERLLRA